MRCKNHWLRSAIVAAVAGAAGGLWGQSAWADSILVKSLNGTLLIDNVHVSRIENDEVYFTTSSETEDDKPITAVIKFSVDAEPAFTAAEDAFASGDWKKAADNYSQAITATGTNWIKTRASIRLMEAAANSGDFQAAVKGFLAMADRDPNLAKAHRPDIASAKPADLDGAIPLVKADLDGGSVKTDEQKVLLPFLAELYMRKGDTKSALDMLTKETAIDPEAAKNPLVMRAQASIALGQAGDAIKQSKFQDAENLIEAHQAAFIDPAQQADGLYVLAQAKEGLANKDSPDSLKDAAVAYMRVVAMFKDTEGKPHVADSLFKAGAIYEQLAKPDEAVLVYQQVPALFKDAQLTDQAAADIQRLQPPKPSH